MRRVQGDAEHNTPRQSRGPAHTLLSATQLFDACAHSSCGPAPLPAHRRERNCEESNALRTKVWVLAPQCTYSTSLGAQCSRDLNSRGNSNMPCVLSLRLRKRVERCATYVEASAIRDMRAPTTTRRAVPRHKPWPARNHRTKKSAFNSSHTRVGLLARSASHAQSAETEHRGLLPLPRQPPP